MRLVWEGLLYKPPHLPERHVVSVWIMGDGWSGRLTDFKPYEPHGTRVGPVAWAEGVLDGMESGLRALHGGVA